MGKNCIKRCIYLIDKTLFSSTIQPKLIKLSQKFKITSMKNKLIYIFSFIVIVCSYSSFCEDTEIAQIIFASALQDVNKKQYNEALSKLKKALNQYPNYTQAYYYMGRIYQNL
ncbi:MAG: hypothetical protein U9O87_04115, partial [Verrucomicrobiota bacterium]|nr:hypothetical protein [Verrucomicrobiota bacterium]